MLTRSLASADQWPPGSLGTQADAAPAPLTAQAPGIQGSWHLTNRSTYWVKMEAHITSIRIPPQQDWFAWTAVVPTKHVYPARDHHITRVTWGPGSGHKPSGATRISLRKLCVNSHQSILLCFALQHLECTLLIYSFSKCSVAGYLQPHSRAVVQCPHWFIGSFYPIYV